MSDCLLLLLYKFFSKATKVHTFTFYYIFSRAYRVVHLKWALQKLVKESKKNSTLFKTNITRKCIVFIFRNSTVQMKQIHLSMSILLSKWNFERTKIHKAILGTFLLIKLTTSIFP